MTSSTRARTRPVDLTTGEVARAIGVSESSIKRWVDRGDLPSHTTAGGHRRLPADGVIRFLRASGQRPAHPEVLGLPRVGALTPADRDRAVDALFRALADGDESPVRAAVLGRWMTGDSVAELCDQLIAPAFHRIGDAWEHRALEVYRERRAVELATRALGELRALLPEPGARAPRAIGATLEGDPYSLSLEIAGLVLREHGWRAESLGPNQPIATLRAALGDLSPKLLWLSVNHVADRARLVAGYPELYEAARARGTAVVLGGRALEPTLRAELRGTAFCGTMTELVGLCESLAVTPRSRRTSGR